MADRPILFSAPMVQALLDGRKTQTRRVLGKRTSMRGPNIFAPGEWTDEYVLDAGNAEWRRRDTPYAVGDRLWVKETFARVGDAPDDIHACPDGRVWAYYRADAVDPERQKWRSSLFMPRVLSRLTLLVTDVRVERLQDIREADAEDEGWPFEGRPPGSVPLRDAYPIGWYLNLWDDLHGEGAAALNPWVAAISFRVVRANIDAPEARTA